MDETEPAADLPGTGPMRPRIRPLVGDDGDPEVFCADEQTDAPVELERWRDLALAVLAEEGVRGAAELSLLFVTEEEMTQLHGTYLGEAGPTDVLSFPIDGAEIAEFVDGPGAQARGPHRPPADPGDFPLLLGDVVVCPAVALAQCGDHAGTYDDEMALLVVHGILHVLGHDHAEPDGEARMRAKELHLLQHLHWHGPAPRVFRQEHAR